MNYRLNAFLCMLSCAVTLCATDVPPGYVSPKEPGEYDEVLECIIGLDGICVAGYVDEVLEECKDCDFSAPDIAAPSSIEVFLREQGLSLLESALEHPKTAAVCGGIVLTTSVIGTIASARYLLNYMRNP